MWNYCANLASGLKSKFQDRDFNKKGKGIINMPSISFGGPEDNFLVYKLCIELTPGAYWIWYILDYECFFTGATVFHFTVLKWPRITPYWPLTLYEGSLAA